MEISSPLALEALNNPHRFPGLSHLIECTLQGLSCFQSCLVEFVNVSANRVTDQIAVSVTNDGVLILLVEVQVGSMTLFLLRQLILHLYTQ
ncbi:unnamed protein product, partial [Brassica rapa subsp. trilocularis]